jgi:hypothetical protein
MQLISDKTLADIEKSLGLDLIESEKKNDVMSKIISVICSRSGIRIIKNFSDEEAKEFNLIPEDDLEKMENYILAKNPDARNIFEDEAEKLKNEMLNAEIV